MLKSKGEKEEEGMNCLEEVLAVRKNEVDEWKSVQVLIYQLRGGCNTESVYLSWLRCNTNTNLFKKLNSQQSSSEMLNKFTKK